MIRGHLIRQAVEFREEPIAQSIILVASAYLTMVIVVWIGFSGIVMHSPLFWSAVLVLIILYVLEILLGFWLL